MSLLELVAAFGESDDGPSAAHSGNMGDVIYSLPACAELGVTRLVLNLVRDPGLSRRAFTAEQARFLAPLLLAQPGLRRIEARQSPIAIGSGYGEAAKTPMTTGLPLELVEPAHAGVDHILDRFRLQPLDRRHLVRCHSAALGCRATGEEPFLTLPVPVARKADGPVILSLTPRYRNHDRAYFARLLDGIGPIVQIGIADEAHVYDGLPGSFTSFDDALDLARFIASARLFIGSPSLPYAIAEGLKVPRIVDVPEFPLNAFPLGENGWVLPDDVDAACRFIHAILDGTEPAWSASWTPHFEPPRHRVGVGLSRGGAFAFERFAWIDLEPGDGARLAALELAPDAAADGLRLDLDTPHRGLLITRLAVETATGAPVWALDFCAPGLSEHLASLAAQSGGCAGFPVASPDGILVAKSERHSWFGLPVPPAALAAFADGATVRIEIRPWGLDQTAEGLAAVCRDMRAHHEQSRAAAERQRAAAEAERARADAESARAEGLAHEIHMLRRSASWRATRPLRGAIRVARALKRAARDPSELRRLLAARGLRAQPAGREEVPAPIAATSLGIQLHPTARATTGYATYIEATERRLALVPGTEHPKGPVFSLMVRVNNPDPDRLRTLVDSVRLQKYGGWELCLAEDRSADPAIAGLLDSLAALDARIKLAGRKGSTDPIDTALGLATGSHVGFLDQHDLLHPACLAVVARHLAAHPRCRLVYTDEDRLREGARTDPYFKPGWSPTLMLGRNFLAGFCAVERSVLETAARLPSEASGARALALTLRCLEQLAADEIGHVGHVLYHRRAEEGMHAAETREAERRAIAAHLRSKGVAAIVQRGTDAATHRVQFPLPDRVGIVLCVDARGQRVPQLSGLAEGFLQRHPQARFSILLGLEEERLAEAEDGSLVVPLAPELDEAGGWCRLLAGAQPTQVIISAHARCLPDDVACLEELASQALRSEVGVVGGLALDAAGHVWHAGLILDANEGILLPYAGHDAAEPGSHARLQLAQEIAAVAPYCLALRSELLGGLTADRVAGVTAAALQLQQRLRAEGKPSVWTPHARFRIEGNPLPALFGSGLTPAERQTLQGRAEDPFYHPSWSRHTLYDVGVPVADGV